MQHLFWLRPDRVAGRSGPCKDPWNLCELRAGGIGAVLSVNDGLLCQPSDFARHGIRYQCQPLSPNAPPQTGDAAHCRKVLPWALAFIRHNEQAGQATLIHCHSGKDRTGLLMAYYLTESEGLAPADAIAAVRAVRPIAFSAPGWDAFALEVLSAAR